MPRSISKNHLARTLADSSSDAGAESFLRNVVRTRVSIRKANVHVRGRLYDISGVQLQQTEPAPTVTATLNMEAFYFSPTAAPAPVVPTSTTTTPAS